MPDTREDARSDLAFCRAILPQVSRTFALGIRLLPPALSEAVMVAYLLCRVADTIEDAVDLTLAEKKQLLALFARSVDDDGPDPGPVRERFVAGQTGDERLALHADRVLRAFRRLTPAERQAIRPSVQEMCKGMAEFAREAGSGGLQALVSLEDLDRYCYYVAGTVGNLLTALFSLHIRQLGYERHRRLSQLAPSFGLGLQLTNIVRDMTEDHRRGWSFVPRELCERAGISPDQLFSAGHAAESRQVMDALIERARSHLADALEYCTNLPRREPRIRLFCLSSLFFAGRTLRLVERQRSELESGARVKMPRREVYGILALTSLIAPSNGLLRGFYKILAGRDAVPA